VICLGVGVAAAENQPASKATAKVGEIFSIDEEDTWVTILEQDLKTPNGKDLFIDVSLECGLRTNTKVQSRKGNTNTASATAEVLVRVLIDDNEAELALPGVVTYCRRTQELTATFDGILTACLIPDQGCLMACTDACTDADGNFDTDCFDACAAGCGLVVDPVCLETLPPEEVGLLLDTMNANAFNFIKGDLTSGVHNIKVQAMIGTAVSVTGDEVLGSTAEAEALIGKGSVTVELVRMIKNEDIELE
jgi:hypothetical protein